ELEVLIAAGAEAFRQGGVEVLVAGRTRDADAAVAPRAARRARERGDVQPVVDVLIARRRVADAIRTLVAALALERRRASVDDRNRKARSRLEDAADPPSAEDRIHQWRPFAADLVSLTDRELVRGRIDEVMPRVEEGRPVIPLRLVRVHPVRALRGDAGGTVVPAVVRPGPAQRVRSKILEVLGARLPHARLSA